MPKKESEKKGPIGGLVNANVKLDSDLNLGFGSHLGSQAILGFGSQPNRSFGQSINSLGKVNSMDGGHSSSKSSLGVTTPPSSTMMCFVSVIMPRPGQPGALSFNGSNVTQFLKDWENEYEEYGWDVKRTCQRVADYCTPEVKKNVRMMEQFRDCDWKALKREIKDLYSR